MRSDRLKQVMQEIDPTFDEGAIGFSKFSKFLAEAASRGLISLHKMENGQYEIEAGQGGRGSSRSGDEGRGRRERGRGRGGRRDRGSRSDDARSGSAEEEAPRVDEEEAESPAAAAGTGGAQGGTAGADPLAEAYDALRAALAALREAGRYPVRDSDVKRKILEIRSGFDETELGFPKFSRFLQQAVEHGVIVMERSEAGNYEVSLPADGASSATTGRSDDARAAKTSRREEAASKPSADAGAVDATVIEVEPPKRGLFGFRLGPRRGTTRRRADEAPSLFGWGSSSDSGGDAPADTAPATRPAQETAHDAAESAPAEPIREAQPATREARAEAPASHEVEAGGGADGDAAAPAAAGDVSLDELGLPSDDGAIVRYLTHRYKGVGEKTAEALVEAFGQDLFRTMLEDPDAISRTVPAKRAEQVLDAWRADYERRTASRSGGSRGGNRSKGGGRG